MGGASEGGRKRQQRRQVGECGISEVKVQNTYCNDIRYAEYNKVPPVVTNFSFTIIKPLNTCKTKQRLRRCLGASAWRRELQHGAGRSGEVLGREVAALEGGQVIQIGHRLGELLSGRDVGVGVEAPVVVQQRGAVHLLGDGVLGEGGH
ncbi:hypothetical protein E2C01_023667 [Portunus trituberculatus]|uniref:Uncharacterized protein n=1 Tax=Portunus trituberculatus TaxID=210409 RepID=A0A5B7EBQ8_PORTR|nr:hypothetical protein [Portunus trituberculatus]